MKQILLMLFSVCVVACSASSNGDGHPKHLSIKTKGSATIRVGDFLALSRLDNQTIFYSVHHSIFLSVHHGSRENEYFLPKDTVDRDYITLSNQKMHFDLLAGLKQREYTGSYDCLYAYYLKVEEVENIILVFSDVNFMGTNSSIDFALLQKEGTEWKVCSLYAFSEAEPSRDLDAIKVQLEGKVFKLESDQLEEKEVPERLYY